MPVDPQGNFLAEEILPSGLHTVEVAVLDQEGNGAMFLRDLQFENNDWFYVGIADLTASGIGLEGVRRAGGVVAADLAVEGADGEAPRTDETDQQVLHAGLTRSSVPDRKGIGFAEPAGPFVAPRRSRRRPRRRGGARPSTRRSFSKICFC